MIICLLTLIATASMASICLLDWDYTGKIQDHIVGLGALVIVFAAAQATCLIAHRKEQKKKNKKRP